MSLPTKVFLEIQLMIFKERLIEIITEYGIDSEEAVCFTERLDELVNRYQKFLD